MARRTFSIAASIAVLVACAGVFVLAAERATFVLTSGERKSGAVVFHGSQSENLIDGYLNLGNDAGGPEFGIPLAQVAVIDFAGGTPPASEIQAVPNGQTNLLVMRNGQTQQGRFVNLLRGTTLVWENRSGERQEFPITDVRRVYLNPDIARTAFLGGVAPQNPVATSGAQANGNSRTRTGIFNQSRTGPSDGSFTVNANTPWVDTGIDVRKGEFYTFNASGDLSVGAGGTGNADGVAGIRSNRYPVPANQAGTLIGKVGSGRPFAIGSINRPISMPANGRLMLGINDDSFGDNSGALTVSVSGSTTGR